MPTNVELVTCLCCAINWELITTRRGQANYEVN